MSTGVTPKIPVSYRCPKCKIERRLTLRGPMAHERMPFFLKRIDDAIRSSHKACSPKCKAVRVDVTLPHKRPNGETVELTEEGHSLTISPVNLKVK